jgi:hypothetical protein
MNSSKYLLPAFLKGRCLPVVYERWLERKAVAHLKRDRDRGNTVATKEAYKAAIHEAVLKSEGVDAYTGQSLRWELISTYDNEQSKARGRAYKKELGDLPTLDHVGDGLGTPDFKICAWRTNDAKSDLSYDEFVQLCQAVLNHHNRALNVSVVAPILTASSG